MTATSDDDLNPRQWEALKALRWAVREPAGVDRSALDDLIRLALATRSAAGVVLTPEGRTVLLRGSPRLWDVAA